MIMNRLTQEKQIQVIKCLVEGNSIRSTVRMTGVAKNTIQGLLLEVGQACETYQKEHIKGLKCKRIQCDEIWAYCYSKQKNVPKKFKGQFGYGDVWTFTALDQDTKLSIGWLMGERTTESALNFFLDLRQRVEGRPQLTTDAFKAYEVAIKAFNNEVDYASLMKVYGKPYIYYAKNPERHYSPNVCTAVIRRPMVGNPNFQDICTSHVERANLTMRMGMRRFTRLTNGFSKKLENMKAAVALHFMHYNYCRIHQTLRVTPAMASNLSDHVWEISEVLNLLEKSATKTA
jgi:IS1 family transposase